MKELNVLRHLLALAVEWELIPAGRVRYVQPTELRAVLDACPEWLRPIAGLAVATGMRRGEILGLRWFDINFKCDTEYAVNAFCTFGVLLPLLATAKCTFLGRLKLNKFHFSLLPHRGATKRHRRVARSLSCSAIWTASEGAHGLKNGLFPVPDRQPKGSLIYELTGRRNGASGTNYERAMVRVTSIGFAVFVILSTYNLGAQVIPTAPNSADTSGSVSAPIVAGKFTDVTTASGVRFVGVASHTSHKYLLETTLLLVGHKSNRDAIGAEVKVVTAHGAQYWTVSTSGSYLSSNDKRAHFGLGAYSVARTIEIRWPSGIRQTLTDITADRMIKIDEPSGSQDSHPKAGPH